MQLNVKTKTKQTVWFVINNLVSIMKPNTRPNKNNSYFENALCAISFRYWAPGKSMTEAAAVAAAAAARRDPARAQISSTRPPHVTMVPLAPLATPLWNTISPGLDCTLERPGEKYT